MIRSPADALGTTPYHSRLERNKTPCQKKQRPLKTEVFRGLGAAGRIRTADLILTKKPSCFLVSTHSCQEIPPNPLQCKWFGDFCFPSHVIYFFLILGCFRLFVGRFVGSIWGDFSLRTSFFWVKYNVIKI